jgi:ketosteroid isomerase-like protein
MEMNRSRLARRFVQSILLILVLSTLAGSVPAKRPTKEPARKEKAAGAIQQVLDSQVTAWNRGDLEGFMAGYWQSEQLSFFSGKSNTRGWQTTLDRYRSRYQAEGKEMGKLVFSDLEIEMLGPDSAFVRGKWKLEMSKENFDGLFTLIFKRVPAGWRIVHDHTSG